MYAARCGRCSTGCWGGPGTPATRAGEPTSGQRSTCAKGLRLRSRCHATKAAVKPLASRATRSAPAGYHASGPRAAPRAVPRSPEQAGRLPMDGIVRKPHRPRRGESSMRPRYTTAGASGEGGCVARHRQSPQQVGVQETSRARSIGGARFERAQGSTSSRYCSTAGSDSSTTKRRPSRASLGLPYRRDGPWSSVHRRHPAIRPV